MYGMNKITKFLIVCMIVFASGAVLAVIGFASGGVEKIDKVAEKYDWLNGSPGTMETSARHEMQFDSIRVDGTVDLYIAGPEYWEDGAKTLNENAPKDEVVSAVKAGDVYVRHGENVTEPELKTENGVLIIQCRDDSSEGTVEMNFSSYDGVPDVIVFCSEKTLEEISVNDPYGDIKVNGTAFQKADIVCDSTDVNMECVTGGDLDIQGDSCNVALHGTLRGNTTVSTLSGDIRFETAVNRGKYDIDAVTAAGEIKDGEHKLQGQELKVHGQVYGGHENGDEHEHDGEHKHDGGQKCHQLKLRADAGDISLWFGDTKF